jgi:hypothetical protein
MKYATVFIVGMAVFSVILFGILFHKEGTPAQKYLIPIAPLIPWPFILPIMAKIMKKIATKSIDTLINNMVTLGQ